MDPAVQGALIAALSALSAGGLATGANVYLESRRQAAQDKRDEQARLHEERQARYDERKTAYEEFYATLASAEQATLELEEQTGGLPGDMGYDAGNKRVDNALVRLQFHASDAGLAAAEVCSRAFYSWGWGGGSHTELYEAMTAYVRVVRTDLGIKALARERPLPSARRRKALPSSSTGSPSEPPPDSH
ncbi:hypothetical protein [Nocardioides kribbensis]|uniref:hypothetical protein n=1 Tax=Nocardioides kribbensis TaxID=305517 RepID=UPI001879EAD2|nr:hypothetical protein [Nocardioides kribbensis]